MSVGPAATPSDDARPGRRRGWRKVSHRRRRLHAVSLLAILSLLVVVVGGGVASAVGNGGTAKPPPPPPAPAPRTGPVFRIFPPVAPPTFTGDPTHLALHQFNVIGFIQDAQVNNTECLGVAPAHWGGIVVVNNLTIVVPCNSVIQMPANTLTWSQFVNPSSTPAVATSLKQLSEKPPGTFPSFEVNVVGNTVVNRHIAGLITISQQSLNQGQGIITSIDFAAGQLHVGAAVGALDQAVVELNDPIGRFGKQHSPDPRFSIDEDNPTVHASTGYPMCVPRVEPPRSAGAAATAEDLLCPQGNRPAPVGGHCRDFIDDGMGGFLPKGGNLSAPIGNPAFCGHFVMPPALGLTGTPDPTKQAPFEVGDYITWAGTLLSPLGTAPSLISAYAIEADVGIFTSHGSKPSYLAIGAFGIGSADPNAVAVNGARQETANRMFLAAETSDVTSPVDIYLPDVDPVTGVVSYRWITPFEMTGESHPEVTGTTVPGAFIGGGITTQFSGVQPQRIRLRATRAPLGLLNSPPRSMLVVNRTLCNPDTAGTPSSGGVTSAVNNIKTNPECLTSKTVANGLAAGRYQAPTFNYIFPENVQKGDPVVPNNLWDLGFLSNGEGGSNGQGPLTPTPW